VASRYIVGGVLFFLAISVRGADPELGLASRAFLFPATQPHSQFSFTLKTPEPELSLRADGSFSIGIDGFATFERSVGAPDIPTKTVLVAIPRDATPKLEVRASTARLRRSLPPSAVPQRYVEVSPEERAELERPGRSEVDRQAILQRSIRKRRIGNAENLCIQSMQHIDDDARMAAGAQHDDGKFQMLKHSCFRKSLGASRPIHVQYSIAEMPSPARISAIESALRISPA